MKQVYIIYLFLLWATPASALSYEKSGAAAPSAGDMAPDAPIRTVLDYIKDYVDTPAGATDWKTFGKTKETNIEGKTKEGYDFQYYKPEFPPEVRKLDGQEIVVKGFMFPLGEIDKQKVFLFGPFPVSCPFHYHVSPALVLEVHADKRPVEFSYDPVLIKGKLQLVDQDPENSTFYRLIDAEEIK